MIGFPETNHLIFLKKVIILGLIVEFWQDLHGNYYGSWYPKNGHKTMTLWPHTPECLVVHPSLPARFIKESDDIEWQQYL